MSIKRKVIVAMIVMLAVSITIAIPTYAGWDLYVGCSGADGWAVYPNGTVCRYDGLTGAFKPGTWQPGQPGEQVKPDCLFAEADTNRPMQVKVKPDGSVHVCMFAAGTVQTYDQYGGGGNVYYNGGGYGFTCQMEWTDNYAYIIGRYAQDSVAGAVAQYALIPATTPAAPLNPWYCEAPFGVAGMEPYAFTILDDGRFMCLDARGHFYWFDADGAYLSKIQIAGIDPDIVTTSDIKMRDGYAYVACFGANQVRRFAYAVDDAWVLDDTWKLSGTLPNGPWGITFGPDGNLYVSSRLNDKILKYNGVTGAHIGEFAATSQYAHYPANLTFVETGGGGGGVTGTITLKDWAGVVDGVAAVIDLRDGTGNTVETKNVTLASDGGFNFTTSLNGSYTAVAKAGHWLAKAMPLNISGGSGSVSFELTNGDCNGDNGVDEIDYALLSNAWYQALGDPAYNPVADLNGDGGVDEIDYAILSNAWYTAGD